MSKFEQDIEIDGDTYHISQKLPNIDDYSLEIDDKNNLVYTKTIVDTATKESKKVSILFSIVPVLIKSIYENISTQEQKLELLFYRPQLKQWQTIVIDKNIVADRNSVVTLTNKGIPINSINSKIWLEYFYQLEQLNYDTIPIIKMTNTLGWYDKCFVPYTDEIQLDIDYKLQRWKNAYSSVGTLENWIKEIKEFRDNNIFRFILSSSFSAPLITPLGHRIFIVFNYGNSRSGKSAALHSALSVWGNPNELKVTFNTTAVGIERLAGFFNDLPLGLDEKQVNKSQSNVEQIIYMLGNGIGKIRGAKTGGIQQMNTWNTVVLATGEETISTSSSTTGIQTRCLEIEGSPFNNDEEKASKVYEIFSNCYGIAGKEFISILLKKYSENDFKMLKDKFNEVKENLKSKTENDISSYISSVSVVTLADIIISKELFNEISEENSYKMGLEILNNLSKSDDIDIVDKCYDKTKSWLLSNHKSFDKYTEKFNSSNIFSRPEDDVIGNALQSFGLYDNNTYFVLRNVLEDFLTKNGYSYNKMVRDFAIRGYIIPTKNDDSKIITPTIQKRFRNTNARMFAFPIDVIEKAEEFTDLNEIHIENELPKKEPKERFYYDYKGRKMHY